MKYKPDRASAVIDVGGGASPLAYKLIEAGYVDVSVVDISQQALDEAHTNAPLGSSATSICADVREWIPTRGYDVWHDRAVLHFLVDDEERLRYARLATGALNTSGILIVAVFAEDGPEMCSGLPVRRATQDDLVALFGAEFLLEDCFR
jgi:trans-aconitate methyltransferase